MNRGSVRKSHWNISGDEKSSSQRLMEDLGASAEDIRQGRIDDTHQFVEDVDREIKAYFAKKQSL